MVLFILISIVVLFTICIAIIINQKSTNNSDSVDDQIKGD